jgi:hypothetical protein
LHGVLRSALALKDSLAVSVELELGDDDVGRMDANWDRGTVDLLAGDTVDVDDPLLTVDLDNLALTALEGTTDNHNFVILANRDGTSLKK